MINIIWAGLLIIGIVYGFISGNIDVINSEILSSGKKALDLILDIMPILVLWMGLMAIAEKSGLLQKIADFFTPFLRKLFPSVPEGNKALGYIASNIAVNMAGLGSAATPFGLKAMDELQKINDKKDTASDAMITFLVVNTSGVTIIPTTVIALRMMHNSANPTEIVITSLIATTCATIGGLLLDYFIRRRNNK